MSVAVITQSEKKQSISDFKVALMSFEETEKSRQHSEDSILKSSHGPPTTTRWKHGATSRATIQDQQQGTDMTLVLHVTTVVSKPLVNSREECGVVFL